jgi:hypothetical protein
VALSGQRGTTNRIDTPHDGMKSTLLKAMKDGLMTETQSEQLVSSDDTVLLPDQSPDPRMLSVNGLVGHHLPKCSQPLFSPPVWLKAGSTFCYRGDWI